MRSVPCRLAFPLVFTLRLVFLESQFRTGFVTRRRGGEEGSLIGEGNSTRHGFLMVHSIFHLYFSFSELLGLIILKNEFLGHCFLHSHF